MKNNVKRPFLAIIRSAGFALLTMVGATFMLAIPEIISRRFMGQFMPYVFYDFIIIVFSFFIVKQNPKSIWYVPIICNAFGIFSALMPDSLGTMQERILIYGGWLLTIIVSIIGARMGKKTVKGD
jgi:hypothetical protein